MEGKTMDYLELVKEFTKGKRCKTYLPYLLDFAKWLNEVAEQSVQQTTDHVHDFANSYICECGTNRKQVIERRRL